MRGIDVSYWNGKPFNAVTEAGYRESDFVIVKTTEGDWYTNPYIDYAIGRAKEDGKLWGFFHYAEGLDPVAEADFFIRHWRDGGLPVLDWEGGGNAAWGSTTWCRRFVERVHERKGVWPVIYTGMDGCRQAGNCADVCPLWFAGYPVDANSWDVPRFPYTIPVWGRYDIWQFTSGGNRLDRNTTAWTREDWLKASGKESGMAEKGTAARLLEVAQAEVGRKEGTKYGAWYEKWVDKDPNNYDFGGPGVPYCAMFVSWCLDKAGVKCAGFPGAYCPTILNVARAAGKLVPTKDAKPGDIVLFDWDGGVPDHVGIVKANDGRTLRTIEGNADNGWVVEKGQGYGVVAGIVRPDFKQPDPARTVWQYTSNGTDAQKWSPRRNEDGTYTLLSKSCGLALDVKGAGTEKGTRVQCYPSNGTDAQKWELRRAEGAYVPKDVAPFELAPKCAPKMRLDVRDASRDDCADVQLWEANRTNAQRWAVVDDGAGYWTLINAGSGKALDVAGGGK